MNPITILLAEDHPDVRNGLQALLQDEPDFEIVGTAENGRQAVALASKLCPDVVVMDIAMPLLNGLEATRQILRSTASTKILMLSAHDEEEYIEYALALGAVGYVIKHSASHLLPRAIRAVHEGKTFLNPDDPPITINESDQNIIG